MFKGAENFGGYSVKNLKNYKGHDQEPLFQCSVYKDNKRIGFFSEDAWGGPANLDCPKAEDREALCAFAKEYKGEEAWEESYHTFLTDIVKEVDLIKFYKRHCKTKLVLRPESYELYNFQYLALKPFTGKTWAEIRTLVEKEMDEPFIIVNEELDKL